MSADVPGAGPTLARWSRGVLLLVAQAALQAAPPHPTVLMTMVDGAPRPVIKVIGTDPIVVVEGKERRIRTSPTYFAERAPRYGEGTVEFKRFALNGTEVKRVRALTEEPAMIERLVGGITFFEVTVVPSMELRGGSIAVVFYDAAFMTGLNSRPNPQIIVHDLPVLAAGIEATVKFSAAVSGMNSFFVCFVHVFAAGGAELRSSYEGIAARYYARVEQAKLGAALELYQARFSQADHGAVPFVIIKPMLPAGVGTPTAPVTATFSVAENGWVSEVAITGTEDPALCAALEESLRGWLFLPRLKAGQPVASRVQMPLNF